MESIYVEVTASLQSYLDNVSVSTSSHSTSGDTHKQNIKVERIRFSKFDGTVEKWKDFKSMFENHFHNNRTLSYNDRILFLNNYLEDNSEPKRMLSGVQLIGSNYRSTWDSLCEQYDDDRRFMDKRFRDWYRLPHVGEPPVRDKMRKIITTTRNLIKEMPAYGVDTTHWGLWMVPVIVDKLDERSRSRWAMDRPRKVLPDVETLLRYIEDRAEGLEDRVLQTQSAPRRQENNQNSRGYNRFSQNNSGGNSTNSGAAGPRNENEISNREKNRRCPDPACKPPNHEHRLFNCARFRTLNLEERQHKAATVLKVCQLCLRKGCDTNSCTLRKCVECDERHNSLLCPKRVIAPKPMSVVVKPTVNVAINGPSEQHNRRGSVSSDPILDIRSANATVLVDDDSQDSPMLATSLITIGDRQGRPITFRALCDQGSQLNLITTEAYQKLHYGQVRRQFNFIGVGGVESTAQGQVRLLFQSRFANGNRFELTAVVVRKITVPLPSIN